jgi:hypothetical protein
MNLRSTLAVADRVVIGLAVLALVAALTYAFAQPWISTWGATQEEAHQSLAGDLIPFVPGVNSSMWAESFEPNRWMHRRNKKGEATWAWQLYLLGEGART